MAVLRFTSEVEVNLFVNESRQLSILYFFATWAPECQHMTEVYQVLAGEPENKGIRFGMVDAEDVQDFCKKNNISSVPTVVFFKDSKSITRIQGANAAELTKTIASLRNKNISKEVLNARLKDLINRAPVMLFMKGTPEEARCGFSRRMLEILRKHNIHFDSFDVLSDETVREGLKIYSDWPTYPQLYVKGELVGGVDIVTQMDESGELASVLSL